MGIEEAPSGFLLTTVERVINWARKSSTWGATFGLACCAIEMMAAGAPHYDLGRWGMEVFRASPRRPSSRSRSRRDRTSPPTSRTCGPS